MDKNSIELEPIYVRINQVGVESTETESFEELPPIQTIEPKKRNVRGILLGVALFFLVFWVTSVFVSGYFVVSSLKQCIHPPHHQVYEKQFNPEEITALDLFSVAGTVTVRSCPMAKQIHLKVTQGGDTEELLARMHTAIEVKEGVVHVLATGPSFDWQNCQLTHIELTIPTSVSHLELFAQTISGYMTIDSKATFKNVELEVSAGVIRSHHLKVTGSLDIRTFVGYVSLRDAHADTSKVLVQTGAIHLHHLTSRESSIQVVAGFTHLDHIFTTETLVVGIELGAGCLREIAPAKVTMVSVDYGYLRMKPTKSACYSFAMKTNYGQLSVVNHVDQHSLRSESTTAKSGLVGKDHSHSNIMVSTNFGSITLIADQPITWL